jgi:Predicted esterase of the alpha-beta hydrolase superfamily
MTRRALVLSSGGARGSFEVGVLEELILNRGLDFHIFCGISAGALNTSVLAQARFDPNPSASVENLKQVYLSLRNLWLREITGNRSIFCKRLLGILRIPLGADSLYTVQPLENILKRSVDPQKLAQSNRDLRIQYVALETGELCTVKGDDPNILKKVLASATVPFFFPPVRLDGKHLVDGGVRDNTPLGTAFDSEPPPEEIYVIYASPVKLEREDFTVMMNAQHYVMRSLEILLNEIDITDVDGARQLNTLKKNWEEVKPLVPADHPAVKGMNSVLDPIKFARIIECRPEKLFTKDGLNFDPTEIRNNYEHGKEMGALIPK